MEGNRGGSLSLRCRRNNVILHPSKFFNERNVSILEAICQISCVTNVVMKYVLDFEYINPHLK